MSDPNQPSKCTVARDDDSVAGVAARHMHPVAHLAAEQVAEHVGGTLPGRSRRFASARGGGPGRFVERGADGALAVLEDDHLDDPGEEDEHDTGGHDERDEGRAGVTAATPDGDVDRRLARVVRARHGGQRPSWPRT